MKKAWKYTLVAVGIPLLCFGGLGLDSYYRAVSAIASHDARLAKDIAAQRARHGSAGTTGGTYEGGHSAQLTSRFGPTRPPIDLSETSVVRRHLGYLAEVQNYYREAGYSAPMQYYMGDALRSILFSLSTHPFAAAELRGLKEGLDRIHPTRPTLADIITGEHLLDRAEVLNVLHRKEDRYCMIRRPPGWREFFSWRIMIAKALNELDDQYREIQPIGSLPFPEAIKAVEAWSVREENPGVRSRTYLKSDAARMVDFAATNACAWEFLRVALALSRFQAEKGRNPEDLKELISEYLPKMPVSPFNGTPYEYQEGKLRDVPTTAEWSLPLK